MNPSDELVLLIQSIVDKKVRAATLNIKNITSAGDLALTSMGDIRINTAGTHKAYYNGTEIGGSGITSFAGRTGAVTPISGDYSSYFLLKSGDTMTGTLHMNASIGGPGINLNANYISGLPQNRDWDTLIDHYALAKSDLIGTGGIFSDLTKTLTVSSTLDATTGKIILPYSTSVPANCVEGQVHWESDADRLWIGSGTNTWVDFWARGVNGKIWLNAAHTAWLIMNGSDCELHLPAGGAFVTVIEE